MLCSEEIYDEVGQVERTAEPKNQFHCPSRRVKDNTSHENLSREENLAKLFFPVSSTLMDDGPYTRLSKQCYS